MAKRRYLNCTEVVRNGKKIWRARLTFPFDHDLGYKPADKDFYGATAAEADAKRKAYKPEKKGLDKNTSFLQYIQHEFLKKQEELAIAGQYSWQHFVNRKRRLERFLLEPEDDRLKALRIRKVRLGAVNPDHVKDFFHSLIVAEVKDEYRRKLKDDLSLALREARKRIPHLWQEYFEDVSVPRGRKTFSQREIYDWRQVCQSIIDESKPVRDRCLVAFAMTTMRRPSELFALRWRDIDWQRGQVVISKAVVVTHRGMAVKNSTKNGEVSTIDLSPVLLHLLQSMKQEVLPICQECGYGASATHHRPPFAAKKKRKEAHHQFVGKTVSEDDFIFVTERGKPLNKENFKRPWKAIKDRLGFPDGPDFYSLKHMANSALQENGVSVAAIAERMGHKNDEMARLTYRKVQDSERRQIIDTFSKMLSLAGPQE